MTVPATPSRCVDARLRRALGGRTRTRSHGVRPRRGPAGGADRQLRGRPPEPRRRVASCCQDLTRIDDAIGDGSCPNEVLRRCFEAGARPAALHLLGLVSDGGVHARFEHLRALVELAAERACRDVVVHAFTDGRDTLPDAGARLTSRPRGLAARQRRGRIATVTGRYFAMDRDKRWDRDPARRTTHRPRRAEPGRRVRRRGGARRLRARRDRRVRRAHARGREAARSATATPCCSSTSAPTARASSRAR